MKLLDILSHRKNLWLFAIIFIEGYVVLATELLAIRLLVPFVGSGTEIISIIISAVLLPLAVGYHVGGSAFKRECIKSRKKRKAYVSLRQILVRNITAVMVILCFGLSYFFLELFFSITELLGFKSHLVKTVIYCAVFLIYPVYLLGQTIPIVSNYFSKARLSETTGTMLFFSTLGSFLGSVFSTLILMMIIGVNNTVIVTMVLLLAMIILIKQRLLSIEVMIGAIIVIFSIVLNNDSAFLKQKIYENNAYSTVAVFDVPDQDARIMSVNRSFSSKLAANPNDRFPYISYIEDNFIYNYKAKEPLSILVIGAGGFTIGHTDKKNNYTFVDIDPEIKEVSEKYFLKQKLGSNKKFVPSSARAFLQETEEQYDLIVIDAYTNLLTIPAECTTKEFFMDVKKQLRVNGVVAANFIISPNFNDKFSVRLYNTFGSVFPKFNKQIIGSYSQWDNRPELYPNNIFVYINKPHIDDSTVYVDDLNTYSLDKY